MMPRAVYKQPARKCNEVKFGYEIQRAEPSCSIGVAQTSSFLPHPNYGTIVSPQSKQKHPALMLSNNILKKTKGLKAPSITKSSRARFAHFLELSTSSLLLF